MCKPLHNVSKMQLGEEAVICCLDNKEIALKLMEMGCLPGTKIKLEGTAPMGDPIIIRVDDEYSLSLRKEEAATIMLQ